MCSVTVLHDWLDVWCRNRGVGVWPRSKWNIVWRQETILIKYNLMKFRHYTTTSFYLNNCQLNYFQHNVYQKRPSRSSRRGIVIMQIRNRQLKIATQLKHKRSHFAESWPYEVCCTTELLNFKKIFLFFFINLTRL